LKVLVTPSARLQFLEAIAYIRRDSPAAASSFVAKAARSLSRLRKFPQSGRPLIEFPDLPFREVVVPPYRFFYRVKDRTIWIVAAWRGAQLPEEPEA
jgi:toxin ParE1/3/4